MGALRELTLRQAAHEADLRQSAYDETCAFQIPRISEARAGGGADNPPKERILLHITADPSTAMLIRRGRRVADYLHTDCTALFVHQTSELAQLAPEERQAVEKHLRFARSLQIETRILAGSDIAKTVVDFARHNQVMLTAQFYSPAAIFMIDLDDKRLAVAREFGANTLVNSTDGQAAKRVMELTDGAGVDVAIEAVGLPATFAICQAFIGAGGASQTWVFTGNRSSFIWKNSGTGTFPLRRG